MSFYFVRLGFFAGLAILLTTSITGAHGSKEGELPGRVNVEVFNVVEGRSVVVTSVPDGTRVEKGEIVCELDTSDLRSRLATQEIVVRAAEFDLHGATLRRSHRNEDRRVRRGPVQE